MEKKIAVETAKRLLNDEGIMQLLTEYLLEPEEQLNPQLIETMDDTRLGQITRGGIVADVKVKERFGRIKNLAAQAEKPSPTRVRK